MGGFVLSTACGNESVNTSMDVSTNEQEELVTSHPEANLKEEYLQKITDTKKEIAAREPADSSTYAMKAMEDDRWVIWDDLLNEIYEVLKEQLPPEKMC